MVVNQVAFNGPTLTSDFHLCGPKFRRQVQQRNPKGLGYFSADPQRRTPSQGVDPGLNLDLRVSSRTTDAQGSQFLPVWLEVYSHFLHDLSVQSLFHGRVRTLDLATWKANLARPGIIGSLGALNEQRLQSPIRVLHEQDPNDCLDLAVVGTRI